MLYKLKIMSQSNPKISFGIIVLNGEPFTRYNLRNIYPYAHEIIIAEGASPKAAHVATPNGHSLDGTLEILRRFKAEEDPENKIKIVTAEDEGHPNGFWPGEKDQQSQAYAKYCTGNFLWQVDIDEFYNPKDIQKIVCLLSETTEPTCFVIAGHNYFLNPHIEQVGSYFRHPCFQVEPWGRFRRIFSFSQGWVYFSHRPPTVITMEGQIVHKVRKVDLTAKLGVYMHHYSVFSFDQWHSKLTYYKNQSWSFDRRKGLSEKCLLDPAQWKNISNQYKTINSLRYFANPPNLLLTIYNQHIDQKTKAISEQLIEKINNINALENFCFKLISTSDMIWRNFFYVFLRKPISRLLLELENLAIKAGLYHHQNTLRKIANIKN